MTVRLERLVTPVELEVEVTAGRVVAVAYADDAEGALVAARTLWDEVVPAVQGAARRASVRFRVDGQVVRLVEGRRP